MEFDDILVKESPGLCRCCLSEGCYKDLGKEYTWMNENEVYADMLLECFDISISQHNEGPNGPNRLICEVCITRLRDACNFKKQVLDSEKKFIDMVGRGEFRPKVLIYQAQMKAENEEVVDEVAEVEYLEDDMEFGDDELIKPSDNPEPSVSEDITVTTLPVKNKRGRPKKNASPVKPEKKKKLEDKARTSKAIVKGLDNKRDMQNRKRLQNIRRNVLTVLRYGKLMPFNWNTTGFRCFYCGKVMRDCLVLREHTESKHSVVDLENFIPKRILTKDVPIKIDITDIACKFCPETSLKSLEELISHIEEVHDEDYDQEAGVCIFPFVLENDIMQCVICDSEYDNFTSLIGHMNKEHIAHGCICQICGVSFINSNRLKRHINHSHVGHRCTLCGKMFEASHKLDWHRQRIHGIVKTLKCGLCSAMFVNKYQEKVHMGKVHNVEKYKIKCKHCPKICTTKGAMVLHERSLHSDVRYKCDLCEYKTAIKWMIKLHKRKHFGEKNYSCSLCERKFGRSSNLRAHMKVHTGQNGRVCRRCHKGFVDMDTLNQHELESHYFEQM